MGSDVMADGRKVQEKWWGACCVSGLLGTLGRVIERVLERVLEWVFDIGRLI